MRHAVPVVGGPVAGWRGTGGQGKQPSQYSAPPQGQAGEQHCKEIIHIHTDECTTGLHDHY